MRQIKLLGTLEISEDSQSAKVMKYSKGCALLIYLLVTKQAHSREAIADMLWDATSTQQSLRNLRSLLHKIRPSLPELQVTRTQISYRPSRAVTIDLTTLDETLAGDDITALNQALTLYKGELADGFYLEEATLFNEWLVIERERMRQRVWDGYRRICAAYSEQEAWDKGVETARRWVLLDELDEEVQRQLIQFLVADGQISAAVKQFEACRQILWDELGVEPEPATVELGERLAEMQEEIGEGFDWEAVLETQLIWPEPDELADIGMLPAQARIPYHRNAAFIGRKPELLAIADHLLPSRTPTAPTKAMVLHGMGGLGKTQLAVEYAYRYGRFYPGGVFWLSFADPETIAQEVAAVGESGLRFYQGSGQLSLRERVLAVQNAWQEPIPRLLIFDNCEDELLAVDWLPTSGGCSVLVTSRRGVWPLELPIKPLPLTVLERESSIRLVQRWASHLPDEEASRIADAVGDLPLALQLAGHFLARHKRTSVDDYIAQLSLQHDSLEGRYSRYSPTGHELHVAQTFAVSYAELNEDDADDKWALALLARIACFAPGEPIEEALLLETVLPRDRDAEAMVSAEKGLYRLLELGLVNRNDGQSVSMHRLLVDFTQAEIGSEAAQSSVEEAVVARITPYITYTKRTEEFPIDFSHLQHVTEQALVRSTLAGALLALALGARLHDQGESVHARAVLERGLSVADDVNDRYAMGRILIILATASHRQGLNSDSLRFAEKAEKVLDFTPLPNPAWAIEALFWQGWQHMFAGRDELARDLLKRSYEMSVDLDDAYMIANTLQSLGACEMRMPDYIEAGVQHLEEALVLYQALDDDYYVATVQANLGNHSYYQGNYVVARDYYEASVASIHKAGHQLRIVAFTTDLAQALVELDLFDEAIDYLFSVKDRLQSNWRLAPYFYYTLAKAYLGANKRDDALDAAKFAVERSQGTEDSYERGEAWHALGRVIAQTGEIVWKDEVLTPDICFARVTEELSWQSEALKAEVLVSRARFMLQEGERERAEPLLNEAREIYERERLPLKVAVVDAEIASSLKT